MEKKMWYESWTLWLNLTGALLTGANYIVEAVPMSPEVSGIIVAVMAALNVMVRTMRTSTGISPTMKRPKVPKAVEG